MGLYVRSVGQLTGIELKEPVPISIATSGDNSIIAAPGAGKRIVIVHLTLNNPIGTTNTVTFKSGANVLSGGVLLGATGGGLVEQTANQFPVLFCRANEAFIINLSAATSITGYLIYYVEG